ncbi:MAG: homoserine O-acetyltransferase [bacterium]
MNVQETNSVGIIKTQFFTFAQSDNEFRFESGQKLGPITVAYETYGNLNQDKSNAILIVHALTGDAHAAGKNSPRDEKAGWWDIMIGPDKAFDTNRYFIICSNIIGGCKGTTGPSSINPKTEKPYGLTFPFITINDMVRVQKMLIDHLGLKTMLSVVGGSMGGMQVIEWALEYPEMVRSAAIIASAARITPQAIAFNEVGRQAIMSDKNWKSGNYYGSDMPAQGLSIARMIGHITYLSESSMHSKFGRRLSDKDDYNYEFKKDFAVESYLRYKGSSFVKRFDANSYLYMSKAMDYYDIVEKYGSLEKAFKNVLSKFLVISFSSDWLFPPYQSEEIVKALMHNGKNVSYCAIKSTYGHDAFLLEDKQLTILMRNFLKNV